MQGPMAHTPAHKRVAPTGQVVRQTRHIFLGLFDDAGKRRPGFHGLDDAGSFAVDEEEIVRLILTEREFARRNA